ncbi:hypothetical protein BGW38_003520 [Lunasporangiospora selenospora]|uniref:Sugar-phosphatase n=1 Tax=Lunasporangiospora selenospora TaxID=979761 RepID=A0A9P6KCT2_9FUNG|nr:hypothetical protein BGW38_003520 [Lunasporangiospora selenospora]
MTLNDSSPPVFRCRGLLFDMDGTLIDTTEIVEKHWKVWCDEHNIEFEALISTSHGRPSFEVMKQWAPAHLREEYLKPAYLAQLEENVLLDTEGMIIISGTESLLATAPKERWAVVTSAGYKMADKRFIQTKLTYPPTLVTASHVSRGKPDPEGYLAAAKILGFDPKDCVVFEDTPAGIRAGLAAGALAVVGMDTGTVERSRLVEAGASIIVKNFEELEFKFLEDGLIEIYIRKP